MTNRTYQIGTKVHLPDGPTVELLKIEEGTEHGEPVLYLTGINTLGQEVTRWVRA